MITYLLVLLCMARMGVILVTRLIMISDRCSSQAPMLLLLLISCLRIDATLEERCSAGMIAQLTRPVSDAIILDWELCLQSLPVPSENSSIKLIDSLYQCLSNRQSDSARTQMVG